MKNFYERYKHSIPLIAYAIIYCVWFAYIEKKITQPTTIIHMKVDDLIPFCEVFVIPYFLWFVYVSGILFFCFFKDKQEYYRNCMFLFTGMTIFLIISTLWPNGHHLRPYIMPRENIFTRIVTQLYSIDTPTNLWPSIHVYNSLGAHFAIIRSKCFEKKKGIRIGSLILASSIIMATMFIKQHSVFDVLTAFVMAAVMYTLVYRYDLLIAVREFRNKRKAKPQIG